MIVFLKSQFIDVGLLNVLSEWIFIMWFLFDAENLIWWFSLGVVGFLWFLFLGFRGGGLMGICIVGSVGIVWRCLLSLGIALSAGRG